MSPMPPPPRKATTSYCRMRAPITNTGATSGFPGLVMIPTLVSSPSTAAPPGDIIHANGRRISSEARVEDGQHPERRRVVADDVDEAELQAADRPCVVHDPDRHARLRSTDVVERADRETGHPAALDRVHRGAGDVDAHERLA